MANDIREINRESRQRIGETIRNARVANNLTVRALEELTGINKTRFAASKAAGLTSPSTQ